MMIEESRQPRGIVKLNGDIITGWVSFEVENNQFRSADTFRILLCSTDLPDSRGMDWIASQSTILVEVYAGFPPDPDNYGTKDLTLIISGNADALDYAPATTQIELTGRDKTALLIDTKTSEHFLNQTASQIAESIAKRHGLKAVVTATTAKAGSYYQIDHDATTQEQTEWELLAFMANIEDFVLFVSGDELHFEKKSKSSDDKYLIEWVKPKDEIGYYDANVLTLSFSRNLTVAKGVSVEVHSWNAKKKAAFSAFYPRAPKAVKPGSDGSKTQNYRYNIAGLTQEQAEKRAESIYKQIVAHTMNMDATIPADDKLTCDRIITIKGTGTTFDQDYYPTSITRSMGISRDYTMDVKAKNTTPDLDL